MSKKIPTKNKKQAKAFKKSDFVVHDNQLLLGSQSVLLYRFVYSSFFSFTTAILVLASFLLQGVEMAYANEGQSELNDPAAEITADSVMVAELEAVVDEVIEVPEDAILFDTNFEAEEVVETIQGDETEVLEQGQEEIQVTEAESEAESSLEEPTSTPITSSNTPATENLEDMSMGEGSNSGESSERVVEDVDLEDETLDVTELSLESSTTSTKSIEEEIILPEVVGSTDTVSITESDSAFSFTKDECTQLATGSFYCLKAQTNELKDALFSAADADGDLEIFFVKDGLQVQVTHNTSDDASPYYDQNTNTIVWHRQINDRYQIILYNIETQTETVLTNTASNNMEPTSQGDYIVWQRWIDGGWNIILFDGQKEQQLTKTTGNNVAPYIHGSLVVWNRHDKEGKKTIEIYNMDSKTYVTVDDPDGMSVSNPRMVFVYDSLAPNGDVVTKGYDVLAKKFIELDSLPRELPEEIPASDSTGETRALIQSKPSPKSEIEEITGNASSSASGPELEPEPINNTPVVFATTTIESMTLDLSNASSSLVVEMPSVSEVSEDIAVEVDLADYELVIEPFISAVESLPPEAVQE